MSRTPELEPSVRREGNAVRILTGAKPLAENFIPSHRAKDYDDRGKAVRVFPRVLFSQVSQEWRTPPAIYAGLDAEFHFTLDPCPAGGILDGLALDWRGHLVFCNPPYRRGQIARWMAKARTARLAVFLVPVRTTPAWWHDYALHADEIRFFRKRLRFSGATINAPFDSCLVIFREAPPPETTP